MWLKRTFSIQSLKHVSRIFWLCSSPAMFRLIVQPTPLSADRFCAHAINGAIFHSGDPLIFSWLSPNSDKLRIGLTWGWGVVWIKRDPLRRFFSILHVINNTKSFSLFNSIIEIPFDPFLVMCRNKRDIIYMLATIPWSIISSAAAAP